MKPQKVPVSERAILARLNRKLSADGLVVRRCKETTRNYATLGAFYVVDINRKAIRAKRINLVEYARKVGVLTDAEALDDFTERVGKAMATDNILEMKMPDGRRFGDCTPIELERYINAFEAMAKKVRKEAAILKAQSVYKQG